VSIVIHIKSGGLIMKKMYLLGLILCLCLQARSQYTRPFKEGDKVAFVGNSITHIGHYHSYVWLFYMTHFPDCRIQIFNCGIGGDIAGGIYKRLDSDIFSKHPTVVFLAFGMNDTGYFEFLKSDADELAEKNIRRSYQSYLLIEKRLRAYTGARKVLMSSSPYDETAKIDVPVYPGKNEAIMKIAGFQRISAKKNQWGFIGLTRPMTAINLREQKIDSSFNLNGKDRIHPDVDGYLVMAYLILEAQGLAGKEVAGIGIDIRNKMIRKSVNCDISNLAVSPTSVRFDYLAHSLPFPIDTALSSWNNRRQSDALSLIRFMMDFDNENLAVSGLPAGKNYILKIDNDTIGRWSSRALAAGINLAEQTNTPEYQQSQAIRVLNEERWTIEKRLRDYYWIEYMYFRGKGMLFQDDEAAVDSVKAEARHNIYVAAHLDHYLKGRYKSVRDAWKAEMTTLTDKIYAINKPKKHRVSLFFANETKRNGK